MKFTVYQNFWLAVIRFHLRCSKKGGSFKNMICKRISLQVVASTLPSRATSTAIATPTRWGSTWAGRCSLSPRETSEKVRSGIKRNFSLLQLLYLSCFSGEEVTDNYCAVFSELGVLARKQFLRVRNRFGFLYIKLSINRRTSFSLVSAKLARRSGRRTASCRPARPLRRWRQEREKKIETKIEKQNREKGKVIEEMEIQRHRHCETLRWRTSCASTRWTTWPRWREERSTRRSHSIAKKSLSSR